MGILYLIRHAQASPLEQNYDKLSELGEAQNRLLGEYWTRHGIAFDFACIGPHIRQKSNVRLVNDAYCKAGLEFPEPLVFFELDEYLSVHDVRTLIRFCWSAGCFSKTLRRCDWPVGSWRILSAGSGNLA